MRFFARVLGLLRLADGQRWLDVRVSAPGSAMALSHDAAFAPRLPELGHGNWFKPGDVVGSDRRLTQAIARWAHENGFAGIAYSCSHDLRLDSGPSSKALRSRLFRHQYRSNWTIPS
jgi:hypothetical protein